MQVSQVPWKLSYCTLHQDLCTWRLRTVFGDQVPRLPPSKDRHALRYCTGLAPVLAARMLRSPLAPLRSLPAQRPPSTLQRKEFCALPGPQPVVLVTADCTTSAMRACVSAVGCPLQPPASCAEAERKGISTMCTCCSSGHGANHYLLMQPITNACKERQPVRTCRQGGAGATPA